jgi:hypothetical protein
MVRRGEWPRNAHRTYASQKLKDIQIAMMPAGGISGRIVDRNGEPISRATFKP